MQHKLYFVYNAESGFFNKVTDFAHKIFSPDTYACSLCALTYGKYTIKQAWSEYVQQLPMDVEFVYKDKWKFAPIRESYPLVALQTGENRIEILLEAEELDAINSLEELISELDKALKKARY
jgi:hypothetical protein